MANSYDEILYRGHPFSQTHPDRLATIGRLFGMQPAPVDRCRVLELGCGDGGNLIPMAYTLPGSEFAGIDNGACGIAIGQQTVEALGLANVQLRMADIREACTDLGKFDYIIAHGVYSWVPPDVQDAIWRICRENLNPQGIAYISHSVYPGAHVKVMVAEILKFHAKRFAEPRQQIEQARALLGFLSKARSEQDPYALLLRDNLDSVAARDPNTVFHDELSPFGATYFWEFANLAASNQLQYLGDADFWQMQDSLESAEVTAALRKLAPTLIDKEQYMDFMKCRRFRRTLLCRADVALNRQLQSQQMREFFIAAAHFLPEKPSPPMDHPIATAGIDAAYEAWPAAMSFDELLAAVRARIGAGANDALLLADSVLACYACDLVQLHVRRPEFAAVAGALPRASALARRQAGEYPFVTNLCHATINLDDDISRRLLTAMDGTRDRGALLEEVRACTADAQPEQLERALERLAKLALLEA